MQWSHEGYVLAQKSLQLTKHGKAVTSGNVDVYNYFCQVAYPLSRCPPPLKSFVEPSTLALLLLWRLRILSIHPSGS